MYLPGNSLKRSSERPVHLEALEARTLLTLLGNSLFPADNPWNQKIINAPVAANSATLVASIGAGSPLHPDFGAGLYQGGSIGIPYNVVSGDQAKTHVVIDAYPGESDLVDVPIPPNAVIDGDPLPADQNDGDRHLIVYDKDHNIGYELFNVHRPEEEADHQWHADSEAVWDMGKNSFRTPGYTSADAAGLPILPGLVRPDEVLDQGVINHAIRFTVPQSRNAYVYPASHEAGKANSALPRMGERFRLKQSFNISSYSAADRVILQALKDYGMIVADNGSSWFISGTPSDRWNNDDLHLLTRITGNNFEAVDLTPIVTSLDQTAGPTVGGTAVRISGLNYSGAAGKLQVVFGSTPATNVTIQSDGVLVASAPAHAAGTVDVRVKTPYGISVISTGDQFSYGIQTIAGDANSDGMVDVADFQILYRHLGQAGGFSAGDFNGDGLIDFGDFQILELNFGNGAPTGAAPVWTNAQAAVITPKPPVVRNIIIARRGGFSGWGMSVGHDAVTISR